MGPSVITCFCKKASIISALFICGFLVPVAAAMGEARSFGIARFTMQTTRPEKIPYGPGIAGPGFTNEPYTYTQAGGHPAQLTTMLEFTSEELAARQSIVPTRDPKDMIIDLPPGLSANPMAVPRCPLSQAVSGFNGRCPVDSQVGVYVIHVFGNKAALGPIVDLTPEAGQSAEFGLETQRGTLLTTGRLVRTSRGYGIRVATRGLPEFSVVSSETTLWGVPAASEHDPERGLFCAAIEVKEQWSCEGGNVSSGAPETSLLAMPTDCSTGPQTATAWADSWEEAGRYVRAESSLPRVTGCNLLAFAPEIEVAPETELADEPTGVTINIDTKQAESAHMAISPPLQDATVTLPSGVSISPAAADGIQACPETGSTGIDMPTGLNTNGDWLDPEEVGVGEELAPSGEARLARGHCPDASTVGEAEATTPLLPEPIKGRVYLAEPRCGGEAQPSCTEADAVNGNIYKMYVELGSDKSEGVNVKLEGKIAANLATGQLTEKFTNAPQLLLSKLTIRLNGGPRALLDNPVTCGHAQTTSDLTSWSAPGMTPLPESLLVPGTPDSNPSSFYEVTGCANPPVLSPGFVAGSATAQAGAFSDFMFTVMRSDREQYLAQLQTHTPLGLAAMLSSVPLCSSSAADTGACPEASQVGSSFVSLGAGSHPFGFTGNVYLTPGYAGAPFGLSIVTHAVAGPLNLGLVVIRARIDVDPQTSALTITSNPLPQLVFGVPLRIQRISVDINRPRFMFNPTNCGLQHVTGTMVGTLGAVAHVSSPFAVGGCRHLRFTVAVKALAAGRVEDVNGASLDVKMKRPKLQTGTEANIAAMTVRLPKQLPVRLTALRNACPLITFDSNPARCPYGSIIGIARASTPTLPGELIGPVYFVSRGRDSFPSSTVVLQGDGVRVDLTGKTVINKRGVIKVVFDDVPDMPMESFELYLPKGPHSLLSLSTNLCAAMRKRGVGRDAARSDRSVPSNLTMRTELTAQNGATISTATRVGVHCASSKSAKRIIDKVATTTKAGRT
jgi:hypothetical protein